MTNKEAIEIIQERIDFKNKEFLEKHVPEYAEALRLAVKALEQKEWIPCSEKLPGKFETVLLSVFDAKTENSIVETGNYDYIYKEFLIDSQMPDHRLCESEAVLAWMPLPKPYRSEGCSDN